MNNFRSRAADVRGGGASGGEEGRHAQVGREQQGIHPAAQKTHRLVIHQNQQWNETLNGKVKTVPIDICKNKTQISNDCGIFRKNNPSKIFIFNVFKLLSLKLIISNFC